MLSLVQRFYCGPNHKRKTRFHDKSGHLISLPNLLKNGPLAATTTALRHMGYRPELPWISLSAIRRISGLLRPDSVVLEFGSGMSTVWLARHSMQVYSVEDSPDWFRIVSRRLSISGLDNVSFHLRSDNNTYTSFFETYDVSFDLILVDGAFRHECLRRALPHLKPGGSIYLDDTDYDSAAMNIAHMILRNWSRQCGATLTYYTDFAPTDFVVRQGVLARTALAKRERSSLVDCPECPDCPRG